MASDTIKAVRWTGSDSPLAHPAFRDATLDDLGGWVLPYPYWNPSLLKGKAAQEEYCEMKIKHLRSWGIWAVTVDVPRPAKPRRSEMPPAWR